MTFVAIKKVGQGLTSPRVDFPPRKPSSNGNGASGIKEPLKTGDGDEEREQGKNNNNAGDIDWGYFDVAPDVVET